MKNDATKKSDERFNKICEFIYDHLGIVTK